MRLSPRLALLAALALACAGCDGVADYLTNRFKTCEDVRVDLVNSEQSRFPIHITGPGESRTAATLLQSGQSRSISLCLERGDRKRFLAANDAEVVATVNCVAFKASYEGSFVRVLWTPAGLVCQDW
jgi:hypothetical protein